MVKKLYIKNIKEINNKLISFLIEKKKKEKREKFSLFIVYIKHLI